MVNTASMLAQLCRFGLILGIIAVLFIAVTRFNLLNDIRVVHTSKLRKVSTPALFVHLDKNVTIQLSKQTSTMKKTPTPVRMNASPQFQNNLPNASEVRQWSFAKLDNELHKLSRWIRYDAKDWRALVEKSIEKLSPPMSKTSNFTFFELGVGVGAFSRQLLREFPYARGVGVDIAQAIINIAEAVLPKDRMKLYVVSTTEFNMIGNNTFDHIIVSGTICYFPSLASVANVLRELTRIAKPGASMCFTMIPLDVTGRVSCRLIIPPLFWQNNWIKSLGIRVTSLENMLEWGMPYTRSRYAIYLRKESVH